MLTGVESDQSGDLYVLLLSIHGLIRGENLELGRDPDTGGQTLYLVELAKNLGLHKSVSRVDLVTRLVSAKGVDPEYAEPVEELGPNSQIVRIPFGPKRYLRKERLWPYLDAMVDRMLQHFRTVGKVPDIIHGHYADAGYVGAQLARLLGVPFVFTGHSLGRVKRERLLEKGSSAEALERKYNLRRRIEAEEFALDTAGYVIVSTSQEIEEQYKLYDHYVPARMKVIPPGVNLSRFSPPDPESPLPDYAEELWRFLKDREKPIVLAIARPDERKNFPTLVQAFAENEELRNRANLVVIAGNRDDFMSIDAPSRKVLRTLMLMFDSYDLYGLVAYPKQHTPENIPELYTIAARSRGVFVNPALTEPFGLTLIEAAASGLPIVATNDGGPRDIIGTCANGVLVDPLDSKAMGEAILSAIKDASRWDTWSENGAIRAKENYSWEGHVDKYVKQIERLIWKSSDDAAPARVEKSRLTKIDRILVTGIRGILVGDDKVLPDFLSMLRDKRDRVGFCISTSLTADEAMMMIEAHQIPAPDVLIAAAGAEIFYGSWMMADKAWEAHIDHKWKRESIVRVLSEIPEIEIRESNLQRPFRLSYKLKAEAIRTRKAVVRHLRQNGIRANVVHSLGEFLDVLPVRATTGLALRHLTFKWGVPPEKLLAVGYSGADIDLLSGNILGVVVANYSKELETLRDKPRVYFSELEYAAGLLDGIAHYDFFGNIQISSEDEDAFAVRRVAAT